MDVRTLIAKLGGPTKLAEELRLTPPAVANWATKDKIPSGRALDVWKLATAAGVDWSPPGMADVRLVPAPAAGG